jgi:hypothetical protein
MQGIEGLGIQSQINAVTNYVNGNGISLQHMK